MIAKTLDLQTAGSGQCVLFLEHLDVDGRKARIDIKTDSYKAQGHCRLDVLDQDGMKWNNVLARPALTMATDEGLGYKPDVKTRDLRKDFAVDRQWLLDTFHKLSRTRDGRLA